MNFERWLFFLKDVLIIVVILFLVFKSYKYIRAYVKRLKLLLKVKKLCKMKSFKCTAKKYFFSIISRSTTPEMQIEAYEKTYIIKFFACLKRKQTYVLNNQGGYYTTNNFNPILISYGSPRYTVLPHNTAEGELYMSRVLVSKNDYIIKEDQNNGVMPSPKTPKSIVPILCIHPVSVDFMVVRNNRPERIFDGESFQGYTVYSGDGLYKFLSKLQ